MHRLGENKRNRRTGMHGTQGHFGLALAAVLGLALSLSAAPNLVADPSFEEPQEPNQFGHVFARWGGWKYEGDCSFQVGQIARTGKHSALLVGSGTPKIRITVPDQELDPGRYRVTAWLRGLDIGVGVWNQTTEFMFDGKYLQLAKNGTFGWTPLTYVAEVKERKKVIGPSFGLMAPGWLWIDDVSLEQVAADTPLTDSPVWGAEEQPIEPPGDLGAAPVRCPQCAYRNRPDGQRCYACGAALEGPARRADGPPVAVLTSFEDANPFAGEACAVVAEHATDGTHALRLDRSYAAMDGTMDWSGYDLLKADVYTAAAEPLPVYVEIRDQATRDYWTRVNYETVVPPGQSVLLVPLRQLYVGEKSRPGRKLDLTAVTRLVFALPGPTAEPLFLDNVRLEQDREADQLAFDGLWAFDFGTATSPVMDGFTPVTTATLYARGRGYGFADARIWRAFDVLQPDPLYQDFICVESGGFRVDLPNGTYHVLLNLDNPSGYWGEYQTYTTRTVLAQGQTVATDTLDFDGQLQRYFRFWDTEDLPDQNTFDKYQGAYYHEKQFEVEVTDGQLTLGFEGQNWACSLSALVIYPAAKRAQGERFLEFVRNRRRAGFDNAFKRVLHRPTGDPLAPSPAEQARGYVLFDRDPMADVYYNDTPRATEVCERLAADAFAGEYEPVTLGLLPLRDLGQVTVAVGDLQGPGSTIPASAVEVGHVSYRLMRVTMDGAVYTIGPRLILPAATAVCPQGLARRFWLSLKVPADAPPGVYHGQVTVTPERGAPASLPLALRVRIGTLEAVDTPVGPWGYAISVPWQGNEPAAGAYADAMARKSLQKLRDRGFTLFSGVPTIAYRGFKEGQPQLDFAAADAQMALAREYGFLAVVAYGAGLSGLDGYARDTAAMAAAGFTDYPAFLKAVFGAVQKHAEAQAWLPVYYNLCDEPIGDALVRSAENAEDYRKAFPQGPPYFTGASSYEGKDPADPHFRLAKALHVANWNLHSQDSVRLLREQGSSWAFYNGGNRWTYGEYLYKAVTEFGLAFRIAWHWNVVAGNPYYALDCREDDYAWCNATPDGRLVPSVEFERIREGLDDYRRLLTLARLARAKAGTPPAQAAEALIAARLAAFHLGQRDHDAVLGPADWNRFREQTGDAIEALRR